MITLNNTVTISHTIITPIIRQVKIACAVFNSRPSTAYVCVFAIEEILNVSSKFNTLYKISLILLL